jgi:hypothetical protein
MSPANEGALRTLNEEEMVMAACETGYLCDVCGKDVEAITESDLYLRYVMGEVSPLDLPRQRERHIVCNPELAQYIVDPAFAPIFCEGMFAKAKLDADYVHAREALVTRAWRRLQELPTLGLTIPQYPLAEVLEEWKSGN